MDCKKVEKAIFRFLYGESDAHELEHIKMHLDRCGDCRRESEIIDDILSQLKTSITEDPLPDGLRERVLLKIQSSAE